MDRDIYNGKTMERHMEKKSINQARKESSEDMNLADTSPQTPRI